MPLYTDGLHNDQTSLLPSSVKSPISSQPSQVAAHISRHSSAYSRYQFLFLSLYSTIHLNNHVYICSDRRASLCRACVLRAGVQRIDTVRSRTSRPSKDQLTFKQTPLLLKRRDDNLFIEQTIHGHSLTNPTFMLGFWVQGGDSSELWKDVLLVKDPYSPSLIHVKMIRDPLDHTLSQIKIELETNGKDMEKRKKPVILEPRTLPKGRNHIGIVRNDAIWEVYLNTSYEERSHIGDYVPTSDMVRIDVYISLSLHDWIEIIEYRQTLLIAYSSFR
jgi:hypothetical protein